MDRIYNLDELPYKETSATALDNDGLGHYMCLGGRGTLSIVEADKGTVAPKSVKTNRREVNLLRWQHLVGTSNANCSHIVSVSNQWVDVYKASAEGLNLLGSMRAHPFNAADVDWSSFDANALVTCSVHDAVKFWDLREFRRPWTQLHSVAGAEQVKWATFSHSVICAAHGPDLRIWDIRCLKMPLHIVPAHTQKICCAVWHPTMASFILTTGLDGYMKLWDTEDMTKPRHSLGMLSSPVWKLKFSSDGKEFASVPVPLYPQSNVKNALGLWKASNLDILQVVKCEEDVLLDLCWLDYSTKRNFCKCVYSVSRSGKLRKYPYHPSEVEDESSSDQTRRPEEHNASVCDEEHSVYLTTSATAVNNETSTEKLPPRGVSILKVLPPENKIVKVNGSSLLISFPSGRSTTDVELESLKVMNVEGLSADEVDLKLGKASLTYVSSPSRRRIKFALSVSSAEVYLNQSVCMDIVNDESMLTNQQIDLLVQKLSSEAVQLCLQKSEEPILLAIFKKLPELIISEKIFMPQSIEIPQRPEPLAHFSNGSSMESGPHSMNTESACHVIPKSTVSSPPLMMSYDRWIPSPRTCGARFNGSGFLVVFGRNESFDRRLQSSKDSFHEELLWLSSERVSVTVKGGSLKRATGASTGENTETRNVGFTPRSFDEYKQELLSSAEDMRLRSQNVYSHENCPSPQCQSVERHGILSALRSFHCKSDAHCVTLPQHGMRSSASLAVLRNDRSNSTQSVVLSHITGHRRRGNSSTGVLADDHHYLTDGVPVSMVVIYDVSIIMSVSKDLAPKFRLLGGNALDLCIWNRAVVAEASRKDLVNIWQVVELCVRSGKSRWRKNCYLNEEKHLCAVETNSESDEYPSDEEQAMSVHPFGRSLINNILDYLIRINDYQTAAIVVCVLSLRIKRNFGTNIDEKSFQTESNSGTVLIENASEKSGEQKFMVRHSRSGSTCDEHPNIKSEPQKVQTSSTSRHHTSAEVQPIPNKPPKKLSSLLSTAWRGSRNSAPKTEAGHKVLNPINDTVAAQNTEVKVCRSIEEQLRKKRQGNSGKFCSLLDPEYSRRFDEMRHQYADLLFRWRMYSKAAEVMKYSESAPYAPPLKVRFICPRCDKKVLAGKRCEECSKLTRRFICTYCQLPTYGLLTTCVVCGHGGHSEHMVAWFKQNSHCPYGCGCDCKSACF